MSKIWKIQRPLSSSENNPPLLISDKTQVVNVSEQEFRALFPKLELKVYVTGDIREGKQVIRVEDQPW